MAGVRSPLGERRGRRGRASSIQSLVSNRFPKSARLTRFSEFQKVKREGLSFSGRFMILNVLKMHSSPMTRIGIITSRRVGSAVVRNRVRRRFRELVRLDRSAFAVGCWLVIVARHRAATAAYQELRGEWRNLAARSLVLPFTS